MIICLSMCFHYTKIDQAGGPEFFLTLLGLILAGIVPDAFRYLLYQFENRLGP